MVLFPWKWFTVKMLFLKKIIFIGFVMGVYFSGTKPKILPEPVKCPVHLRLHSTDPDFQLIGNLCVGKIFIPAEHIYFPALYGQGFQDGLCFLFKLLHDHIRFRINILGRLEQAYAVHVIADRLPGFAFQPLQASVIYTFIQVAFK